MPDALAGYTVADLARRWRVGEDKVRGFIARGELIALNTSTALCARPRYVVTPDEVAAFEKKRTTAPTPKPARRRRTAVIDFYPD